MMRSVAGFTLLEVLVALAILSGVVTTVVVTFNRHLSLVVSDRENTTAQMLAQVKIAEPAFMTSVTSEGSFAPAFPDYKWKREETNSAYPGLKRYRITVSWQSDRRSLSMVIYGRN